MQYSPAGGLVTFERNKKTLNVALQGIGFSASCNLQWRVIILKALFNLGRDLQSCGSAHGSFPHCFISKYSRLQKKIVFSEHQPQNHEGQKRRSSYAKIIKGSSFLHHYVNKKEGKKKRELLERLLKDFLREQEGNQKKIRLQVQKAAMPPAWIFLTEELKLIWTLNLLKFSHH